MLSDIFPPAESPLSEELLDDLATARGLLVAVSGGPDSTALLLLAKQWSDRPGRPPIFAATVDHGLRNGSREEALAVRALCKEICVPHYVLTWTGRKPEARIQERAREARYALLKDCAIRVNASHVLTGHHADDQVETILFRLLRGSGVAGLAGMRKTRALPGGPTLTRPFLAIAKKRLVAFCSFHGRPYFEDPSNSDPRYARTQLRRAAAALSEAGFGEPGILRLAKRAARAESALARLYADFARSAVLSRDERRLLVSRAALLTAPDEFLVRLLCDEVAQMGKGALPRLERAETLAMRLRAALEASSDLRATLGGMVLTLQGESMDLRPEPQRRSAGSRDLDGARCV